MATDINNIWELYGVRENPFSTSPILVRGGTLSIGSFVGRGSDVKRLGKILGSKGGSRTLIYGDIGVGKTSFVNVVRYKAMEHGFFTPFKEIAVQEDWNSDSFALNTLASIYSTLKLLKDKPVSHATLKRLESIFEIGIKDLQVGLSIGSIGGSYGEQTRNPNQLGTITLYAIFQDIVSEIMANTKKEIVIHYNNLELLPETKLRKILENLRDFFQIEGIHFIFVGNLAVHSNFMNMPRVSSILTDTPILIESLKLNEIEEVIKKRFEILRISPELNYIVPYMHDCLESLYGLWGGNIRNILNSLSTSVLEATNERPIILDKNLLAITLKSVLEKRYISRLQTRAKDVLLEMVKHNEITNKKLASELKIAPSNISYYLKELQNEGLVILIRKEGKDKYWSVEPKVKWLQLKIEDKYQGSLVQYLSHHKKI